MDRARSRPAASLALACAAVALAAGCSTAKAPATPGDPLADLQGASRGQAIEAIARQHPRVTPVTGAEEAGVEHQVATDPKYAELRAALAASGASTDQVHQAISGAFYYGTGQPQDVQMYRWSRLHDDVVQAARTFMDKLGRAEKAQDVHVDRAKLEAGTGLVSLAAEPLTNGK